MSKIIIANWKSNPVNVKTAIKLAKAIDGKNIVIAPPAPFLEAVRKVIKKSALGAQNVFWADGPYTGEVSAEDLKLMKVKYVIIGHSERRKNLKETDEMINLKIKSSLKFGLIPVLCVGESNAIRKKGISTSKNFIKSQLVKDLKRVSKNKPIIVAYEPIWSISTERGAKADTPENAAIVIRFIKNWLDLKGFNKVRVIYGGSVNSGNAEGFLKQKDISGALVGGASLHPLEFRKIRNAII